MKNLIAIILIIATIGLFSVYVKPTYDEIKILRAEKAEYDEAINNSQKVLDTRDELLGKYNSFSVDNVKRLEKLLPNNIDNIRLIIEIDSVASRYNMILKNVQVSTAKEMEAGSSGNQALQVEMPPYGTTELSFDVSGSYETYRSFVKDLEKSLRIIDISGISVLAEKQSEKDFLNMYTFKTSLRTYWLTKK